MMLCISRYESYTKACLRSFQTSGKVLKHWNNQMIGYWVYKVQNHYSGPYRYSQHLQTLIVCCVIILLMRAKCVGPASCEVRCTITMRLKNRQKAYYTYIYVYAMCTLYNVHKEYLLCTHFLCIRSIAH